MDNKMIIAIVAVIAVIGAGAYAAVTFMGKDNGNQVELPNKESRLWVYGNANEDDRIDASDVTYLLGIIEGTKEKTILADANNDGVIDAKDV